MDNLYFRLKVFLAVLAMVVLLGSVTMSLTESWRYMDALYFSVVTVATVGYGDITPVTTAGRIVAMLMIITGVGTFLGVVANTAEIFIYSREREARKEKLHIIVGVFFSEGGTDLLRTLAQADKGVETLRPALMVSDKWSEGQYRAARQSLKAHDYALDVALVDMEALRGFLLTKGELLLRLIENPYIMEHESFTDLLRSALHLKEELLHRPGFKGLPEADYKHLAGDMRRVSGFISREWLDYMQYLQTSYPYLFSLAWRTNPFNPDSGAVVKG